MHRRFRAFVPVAVRDTSWEDDQRARTSFVPRGFDLEAHGAAQDVEVLVDGVRVHAGG